MALAPQCAAFKVAAGKEQPETLILNFLETVRVNTSFGGQVAIVSLDSGYPHRGEATLSVKSDHVLRGLVRLRRPGWAGVVEDRTRNLPGAGRLVIGPDWIEMAIDGVSEATARIRFTLESRLVAGDDDNSGRAALADGAAFTERLARPERAVALRVVGKPACGDNPRQAFSSCAEIRALTE
jgi:hypothetical protein